MIKILNYIFGTIRVRAFIYARDAYLIRLHGEYLNNVYDGECEYSIFRYKGNLHYLTLIEKQEAQNEQRTS